MQWTATSTCYQWQWKMSSLLTQDQSGCHEAVVIHMTPWLSAYALRKVLYSEKTDVLSYLPHKLY